MGRVCIRIPFVGIIAIRESLSTVRRTLDSHPAFASLSLELRQLSLWMRLCRRDVWRPFRLLTVRLLRAISFLVAVSLLVSADLRRWLGFSHMFIAWTRTSPRK